MSKAYAITYLLLFAWVLLAPFVALHIVFKGGVTRSTAVPVLLILLTQAIALSLFIAAARAHNS